MAECETLQRIHHPFVVQMHYAFQDRSRVVFVLEHVAGGDLFTYLQERQAFPESWCRIYTAELPSRSRGCTRSATSTATSRRRTCWSRATAT